MDIIAICGSPRHGNTEFILRRLLENAAAAGHETDLALLRKMDVRYCRGCLACDDTGACPISDDATLVIAKMEASDLIIFGSPNYYDNVSGMMKVFFDRLNVFYRTDRLREKKVVAVFAGGEGKTIDKAIVPVRSVMDSFGMEIVGSLYLCGENCRDVENDAESVRKIDDFSKDIFS